MLKLDYNNMMKQFVGSAGFTDSELSAFAPSAKKAHAQVSKNYGKDMMGWTELPKTDPEIIEDIIQTALNIRNKYENFVVLGIGGSALGPVAVAQALAHMRHNELPAEKRGGAPRFYVEDNVDPERMVALLDVIDPLKTVFNVITKSGATSETMSQYLIITDILKKAYTAAHSADVKNHIIATTSRTKGNLIKLAKDGGYKTFFIDEGVGGRFSQLSPVGLLPAAVLGLDIRAMLDGAALEFERSTSSKLGENPALTAAALQYLSMQKGKNIGVIMPYADGLKYIGDWYVQLWGESLGKNGLGQTPVPALGATDQHSQLQMYMDGPNDKVIMFLGVEQYRETVPIPEGAQEFPDVNFLCGHTLNGLIQAEREATAYAVTKAGKLNFTVMLDKISARSVGQLLTFFMLKTAYCGAMMGVNAFDQPGVEAGKNATYALLGRNGYENYKIEQKKLDKYIL